MHEFARKLKAKTDAGAALCIDNELWACPRWRINKRTISIYDKGGSTTLLLMQEGDDPAEVEADLRERIRVYVPVEIN